MNKILILPMFFLTMCGTAPVTPPAGAFELEIEESHWDKVYHAIEYIKRGEMLGEWMFQYDISTPKRDRVMEKLIFDKTKSIASDEKHDHSHHKHSEHKHSGHDH